MLLRAGLLYFMSVAIVLLGGFAVWQTSELNTRGDSLVSLTRRVASLRKELQDTGRREEAAERRARVAEDSVARLQSKGNTEAEPLASARAKLAAALNDRQESETLRSALEADLGNAIRELEALRNERDALKNDLAALKSDAAEARIAADRAGETAEAAKKDLAAAKRAVKRAPEVPAVTAVKPAAAAPVVEALAATATGALPDTAAAAATAPPAIGAGPAAAITPAPQVEPAQKSAAVTIEADPGAVKADAPKPKAAVPAAADQPGGAERKPAKKVAKKPAKQKSPDGGDSFPFYPF